jgi:dipeptidyl aminopeptidase/acylaminoacyl peptidase
MPMRYRRSGMPSLLLALAGVLSLMPLSFGQINYQKPAPEILEVLHAPLPPGISISPDKRTMLLLERLRYPSIATMAQPMLRLAGLRINPSNNGPHAAGSFTSIQLRPVPGDEVASSADASTAADRSVDLPDDSLLGNPIWSQTGQHFAITRYTDTIIELWVVDVASAKARRMDCVALNETVSPAIQWLPDGKTLLVLSVPADRGEPPAAPASPSGPTVQESEGIAGPVRTYQDLLQNEHEADLFAYYTTAQPLLVDAVAGTSQPWGGKGIYTEITASPDGKLFLTETVKRPFSYILPYYRFPMGAEILDQNGRRVYQVADVPLQDNIPIEGVRTGRRNYGWLPWQGATLVWTEALDDGDPRKKVDHRDKLMAIAAPFSGEPRELRKFEHRFSGLSFLETENLALIRDYDRDKRWTRAWLFDLSSAGSEGDLLFSRNIRDRYNDEGTPLRRMLPNGYSVVTYHDQSLLLAGRGATPQGDRPFLDRFHVPTKKKDRLFQSPEDAFEAVVTTLSADGARFVTSRESTTVPPNLFVYQPGQSSPRAVTSFPDPTPQLRGVTKQLVKYERSDGTQLSFTLYLPPNYQPGTRLPAVVWAYPMEYTDSSTAGQVTGSEQRFTTIRSYSHLFFLLAGYAVLDDTAMPVVGPPENANDTFVKQIVSSAEAAIKKADEMGVIDPNRVAVGGHSYGAFMTANLLAHSRLFRAGIARSGAYNRTLTPFGFQAERRTFWEAPEIYYSLSPFMNAHKIKDPILLLHGEADNNSGTFPVQSERMYQAIRGNGGIVRLVMLPHESHGYRAAETIEHVLWESIRWLDTHVKNAPPREDEGSRQSVQ